MVLALTLLIGLPLTGCAAELVRLTLRRMLSDAADGQAAHDPETAATSVS